MHKLRSAIGFAALGAQLFLLCATLILTQVSCQQGDTSTEGDQAAVPAGTQQTEAPADQPPAAAEYEPATKPDTLAQRIVDFKASREQPAEVKQTLAEETNKLREQGISARAVRAGQQAPDFSLSSDAGEEYALSEMLAQGPVVLIFFRGSW